MHLEIGRPHFDSPSEAKKAVFEALDSGFVHYTSNRGILSLREAITERLTRDVGVSYDAGREVIVTAGGSAAIASTIFALLSPGDEAIVFDPTWPHYDAQIRLAGAVPIHIYCSPDTGFKPDFERVQSAISSRTRLIIVSSPSNPSGAVFDRKTLSNLAELCCKHDLSVISDEIYSRLLHDGSQHTSIASFPEVSERTVIVNSFSKTYSMTGWRVGFAAAPACLADRINTVHQYISVCAPSFAQMGALAALIHSDGHVNRMVSEYRERRKMLLEGLKKIKSVVLEPPEGAFYAFPKVRLQSDDDLALRLLEEKGVAVVPGRVFGTGFEDHIRISYAVSAAELTEGINRINDFLVSDSVIS